MANDPAVKGKQIAHAWVELDGLAYDFATATASWVTRVPAAEYRRDLAVSYVVEYSRSEMWENWMRTDMPGPWDEKISGVIKG